MHTEYKNFFISYPLLKHPLENEKPKLRQKYINLIEYYRKTICPEDETVRIRFERFKTDFFKDAAIDSNDIKGTIKEIMKTRFTPFHFFSYRYIFLFDCIFLLAVDNLDYAPQICNFAKKSISRIGHKNMDFILEKMLTNPLELKHVPGITEALSKSWIDAQAFIKTKEKKVVFTATMSAGKSTLINAIIGQKLSFTKKAACTATVMEFCNSPTYHAKYNVSDSNGVKLNLTAKEVCKTSEKRESPLTVTGYFNSKLSTHKLRFIDTPGVNSSLNPIHKQITRDELLSQKQDVIVYVIPVENYGSEDDYAHLSFICKKVNYSKILFAVNMMDTCDFEDDSIEEILSNIATHLSDIGFSEPVVCPISAKAGLLFKQALSHTSLSSNELAELKALIYIYKDDDYDLSPYYSTNGNADFCDNGFDLEDFNYQQLSELYPRTGLPQFESIVLNTIKEE